MHHYPSMSNTKLPFLLSSNAGCPFNFYSSGQICEGLTYNNSLYRLLQRTQPEQRLRAYSQAIFWAQRDVSVLIRSETYYEVWVELVSHDPLPADRDNSLTESAVVEPYFNLQYAASLG